MYEFLRLRKVTSPEVPPSGFVDLVYDASTGFVSVREADGSVVRQSGEGVIVVSGTTSPNMDGVLYPVGQLGGKTAWSSTGEPFSVASAPDGIFLYAQETNFVLLIKSGGTSVGSWISSDAPSRPDIATGWLPDGAETGTPTITFQ